MQGRAGQGGTDPSIWLEDGPDADAVVESGSLWPFQEVTGPILLFSQSLRWCVAQKPLVACTLSQEDGTSEILGSPNLVETASQ